MTIYRPFRIGLLLAATLVTLVGTMPVAEAQRSSGRTLRTPPELGSPPALRSLPQRSAPRINLPRSRGPRIDLRNVPRGNSAGRPRLSPGNQRDRGALRTAPQRSGGTAGPRLGNGALLDALRRGGLGQGALGQGGLGQGNYPLRDALVDRLYRDGYPDPYEAQADAYRDAAIANAVVSIVGILADTAIREKELSHQARPYPQHGAAPPRGHVQRQRIEVQPGRWEEYRVWVPEYTIEATGERVQGHYETRQRWVPPVIEERDVFIPAQPGAAPPPQPGQPTAPQSYRSAPAGSAAGAVTVRSR